MIINKVNVSTGQGALPDWLPRNNPENCDERRIKEVERVFNIPATLAKLLLQRNLETNQEIHAYLHPQLADLPQPLLMRDMDKAISLIIKAFKEKMPLVIYGDYDVDGKSSTALLVEFFKTLDMEIHWKLPNRISEGYGLHIPALKQIEKTIGKPALLITVDTGINAHQAVEFAKQNNFKVLITDHHEIPDKLPQADAILNPKRTDCNFPCKDLAGVGVAFFLIMGIRQHLTREGFWSKETAPNLKKCLDLVALGTVADVMPMTNTNRILVRAGLEVLSERSRPGIWALCEKSNFLQGPVLTEDISYKLAPRINAAGRLGNPEIAVKLFLSETTSEALEFAGQLNELNNQRKRLEQKATETAIEQCRDQANKGDRALVAYDSWHPGIIGIVSSRLVDTFSLPAIVFTDDVDRSTKKLKGSGRSVNGLNLYNILRNCSDTIIQFGGHEMAVGLTIEKNNFAEFTTMFNKEISKNNIGEKSIPKIFYDISLTGPELFSNIFINEYKKMEPFGSGNPEPIFIFNKIKLERVKTIKNHLKFAVRQNGCFLNGIGFGLGDKLNLTSNPVSMAFKIKTNTFRGERRFELHLLDIAPNI